jgi:hypothetical protein
MAATAQVATESWNTRLLFMTPPDRSSANLRF